MATPPFTNGSDNVTIQAPLFGSNVNMGAGNDNYNIDGDVTDSTILAAAGNDSILATNTVQLQSKFKNVSISGDGGSDTVELRYRSGSDFTVRGGDGNDLLTLRSSVADIAARLAAPATPTTNGATYKNFIYGGGEGNDKFYADNTVINLTDSVINLGMNGNSLIGPSIDELLDQIILGTEPLQNFFLAVDNEGALVQALNVDSVTLRGNEGVDVILLDSLFNPNIFGDGALGTNAASFTRNMVNAGADADLIASARNLDRSTIQGGNGNDLMALLAGEVVFSKVNGNKGADTILLADVLFQNSTVFGGQGEDDINVAAAIVQNSVISGDLGDDTINNLAALSSAVTLLGGEGDDIIDDLSTAIGSLGTFIDGGDDDDTLRQVANILAPGFLDYGSTMRGGTGADTMTGDLAARAFVPATAFVPNVALDFGTYVLNNKTIADASRDLFQFRFGDSAIDAFGNGRDTITDYDSDRSLYWNGADYANAGAVGGNGLAAGRWNLGTPQLDRIELIDAATGLQENISINNAGLLSGVSINSLGQVISGVANLNEFISAGASLSTEGAAMIWTGIGQSITLPQPNGAQALPVTSYLFISDGDGVRDDSDLLIELTNVAATVGTGGLQIVGGRITNIV